ncbi:MAG: phage holin family protein, partial [Chitinophagaceae bacterium]|nr:phage holin family protein [Chitinophagaceae bacterium]
HIILLDIFQKWKDKITGLVESKVRLVQLELIERVSGAMSFLIFTVIFLLLSFGVVMFIGLGIAEMLSELMNSYILGYITVAAFFLILILIFAGSRKSLLKFLTSKFISVLTEKIVHDDDEDENDNVAVEKTNK